MEVATQDGAAALLGPFPTAGKFDSCVSGLQITRMDPSGEAEAWIIVTPAVENTCQRIIRSKQGNAEEACGTCADVTAICSFTLSTGGTLHGGAVATLVDVMGSLALLAKDHTRGGVSVELNVSYLLAVKAGERVTCKGRVVKLGKALGFTQVDLYTQSGKLAATGRHTKAM